MVGGHGTDRRAQSAAHPTTLAELVPAAAAERPEAVALVGLDRALTWADVDRDTRSVADALRRLGVERGDRVAVARRKTHESFEAVHAVLRAGAVVVPIDPGAPPALARRVLDDSGAIAVIGDQRTLEAIDPWSPPSGRDGLAVVMSGPDPNQERTITWTEATAETAAETTALSAVSPTDDAYVIYTSGSTGRPKGIVHTHFSAMAYATRAVEEYGLSEADRVAGMNPLHFDMSTLELYAAPLAGATVVVMSEPQLQFPAELVARSAEHAVTMWYTVPFLLRSVAERGGLDRRPIPTLRSVLYGGEPYPGASLARLMHRLPGVEIVNVYGPAEVNACTNHHVTDVSSIGADVPIGRPWNGVELRIVDDGDDVDQGVAGELWVSAPTVMRGYAGRPDLTAERLRPRDDGHAWYATGDLVVEDDDGILWFRGRLDHQVKVRGVRLELEMIEGVLTDAPGVLHAVAGAVGTDGNASHIAAAIVPSQGADVDEQALRSFCVDRLPPVAVPREFMFQDRLPTTPSGKIDRRTVRRSFAGIDHSEGA